jgi:hypothetical protein
MKRQTDPYANLFPDTSRPACPWCRPRRLASVQIVMTFHGCPYSSTEDVCTTCAPGRVEHLTSTGYHVRTQPIPA